MPHIVGNKDVVYSHIKTPPHYTMPKTIYADRVSSNHTVSLSRVNLNLNMTSTSSLNMSTLQQHVSPGVGDYNITNVDLKQKAPTATIGNKIRFLGVPS